MRKRHTLAVVFALVLLVAYQSTGIRGVEPKRSTVERTARKPEAEDAFDERSKCRWAIERGTAFLLRAMRRDGGVGIDPGQRPDLACTAIVGLALLSQGNTATGGKHCKELNRVLDAVLHMLEQLPENDTLPTSATLVQRKIGRNAHQFFSALFLSQILGEAGDADAEVRAALQRVVQNVCKAQGRDGTWGNESWAPVLGTVMGWECLCASRSSGMHVDASAKLAGEALLKKLKNQSPSEGDWMHDFYKNASSIRVLYSLNYRNEPAFHQCVETVLKSVQGDDRPFVQAGGEEYLAFYLVTECLLKGEQPSWDAWFPTVCDKLMRTQNADGSWTGHHCITGRTFCTAAVLLTLQASNRLLPTSDL